ncbi:hypothetical protein GCM10023318_59340 [Nocardia callitridis]|uniref:Uncharacterized protein n=1 Tax=Nocardia callitridis TaxID=648753 RepID=A0ABP9L2G2_9NOCA
MAGGAGQRTRGDHGVVAHVLVRQARPCCRRADRGFREVHVAVGLRTDRDDQLRTQRGADVRGQRARAEDDGLPEVRFGQLRRLSQPRGTEFGQPPHLGLAIALEVFRRVPIPIVGRIPNNRVHQRISIP